MRTGPGVLAVVLLLALPGKAVAQVSLPGPILPGGPGQSLGHDIAHDPVQRIVLAVGTNRNAGTTLGRFFNESGTALAPEFTIDTGIFADVTRVVYSPDVNNGAGGFLVVWTDAPGLGGPMSVFAQVVSYPSGLVGSRRTVTTVSAPAAPVPILLQLGVAYSPVSRQFLLVWSQCCTIPASRFVRLDLTGQPAGASADLGSGATPFSLNTEFSVFSNAIDVVWNSVSGEFAVAYQDRGANNSLAVTLCRIGTSGTIVGRHSVADVARDHYWLAIAANSIGGNYLIAWARSVRGLSVVATSVSGNGTVMSQIAIPSPLEIDGYLDVAFSPITGTFLLVASPGARELSAGGVPQSPSWLPLANDLASSPQLTALPGGEWLVSGFLPFSRFLRVLRSATRTGGCATVDPFAVLGGGTCVNGGWLPPGMQPAPPAPTPSPTPVPTPVPNGCTTPDPFAALGGGTCRNGGWLPPGIAFPAPTPTPTPTPTPIPTPAPTPTPTPFPGAGGCVGADPFVALGGGTCVNGGWLPPGIASNPTPPPPAGCLTSDPFAAIPGLAGICLNGGWLPTRLVQLEGTIRFVAGAGVWALETSPGVFQQLAVDPPAGIQVDGLAVSIVAKLRIDRSPLAGYAAVIEVVSVFGP